MPMIPDLPTSDRHSHELVRLAAPGEGRLDLVEVFGNEGPVELEIGTGKGRFLLLAAGARPETNFLGIEYARPFLEKAIDRIGKRGYENVRLIHTEAFSFLRDRLADGALAGCHIYFPDPWPKKRHHKRRMIRPAVLDELARLLRPGSKLRVATDHAEYALIIREELEAHASFSKEDASAEAFAIEGMDELTAVGVTNFEIKYRREGRPIHRFLCRRV